MCKILIVEDNPVNLFLYKEVLEKAGHKIVMCSNGIDIVNVIEKETPNVLILDILLPIKTGFEIYNEIKKTKLIKNMYVLFISAAYSQSEILEKTKIPYGQVMIKPIDFKALLSKIDSVYKTEKEKTECNMIN
jgi:two-component system response regulator VicR